MLGILTVFLGIALELSPSDWLWFLPIVQGDSDRTIQILLGGLLSIYGVVTYVAVRLEERLKLMERQLDDLSRRPDRK